MPRVPKPKSLSIRDVAELAGVSLGSASRVINKVDNVTDATRRKVEAAIAQLDYRPNHAAQSLRLRTTRTIGCLLTNVGNPLYTKLFHALEERMRADGYMVLLANSLNQRERELDVLSTFKARGMDGALIAPGNERDPEVLAAVKAMGMPTVILDRDVDTETDRVLFDHVPGMQQAVAHLAALGHRRFGLVVTRSTNRPMQRRVEGFLSGLYLQGLDARDEWIVRLPDAMSPAFDAVRELLQRPDRPTALIAMGTHILNDTLNAISALQLRIPQDISVVSIGDPDFARQYTPPISALSVDLEAAAQESARMLLDRLSGRDEGDPRSVTLACDFIARASCGPAPT